MIIRSSQGTDLYFERRGHGDPLVLIHGAASAGAAFRHHGLLEPLAERFEVLAIDLTGFGCSGRVDDVAPGQWCDDVVSVLDAVGAPRAHLYGTGLGARVAGRVALDHPDRVDCLVVDAPSVAGPLDVDGVGDPDDAPPEQQEGWEVLHGEDWRDVVRFARRAAVDEVLQAHLTLRPHLGGIVAPTLVCHGSADGGGALEWYRAAPNPWLWEAPDAPTPEVWRHVPGELAAYVAAFTAARRASRPDAPQPA